MTGEVSEDGKWIWDGSEWKPYSSTPKSKGDTNSLEWPKHIIPLQMKKKPFRLRLFIICVVSILILVAVGNMTNSELQKWCESEWNNLDGPTSYREANVEDGAPYNGGCRPSYDWLGSTTDIWNVTTMFSVISGIAVILLLVSWSIGLEREYYCGACNERIKKQVLIRESEFIVKSTSATTKRVTTASPQLGMGRIGGKSGSFVSLGSSTSHIPTVLGRILSSHECQNTLCSAINQWQFDAEVQVWTDAVTNEVSHDITGKIQVPK